MTHYFEIAVYGFTKIQHPDGSSETFPLQDERGAADGFCAYWLMRDQATDEVVDDAGRDFNNLGDAMKWANVMGDWLDAEPDTYSIPYSERTFYHAAQ
jgi:hypothetical protein